ncbi:tetratricopeptide repeat protein [Desulfosudis oleivorans]|uniref:Tetratricopeptide TPR_2 repeat protein n=1 Tax=Desulfosudis oleivorans (strain DSM 6200 / JCM 39069 / Hxd3) TaxID=96561 RepID=A8ZVN6_DESOH|nr:tetratricopeptide repeat protein [Desulfosudis oleivorans]ABW68223.1 Tetratricopeptide TPR_2 repeat protein [Desulfosudis oleivorans Hxd3]
MRSPATSAGFWQAGATLLLLAAAGVVLYSNSLTAPFVFDDLPNIFENPHIRITRLSFPDLADAATVGTRRPVASLTFALNYYVHGYNVAGYHVVNIAIHILTGFLMFLVVRQTLGLTGNEKKELIAALAALVWLVNPVHTQAVTYIVQRMTALATLFFLFALYLYIKGRLRQRTGRPLGILFFALCGLSGILAVLSKQIAATLPFFVLVYEWYFFQDLDRAWVKQQAKWIGGAVVIIGALAAIYLGASPIEKIMAMYDSQGFTMGQRLLTEPRVIFLYLSLLFFPHPGRLNLDYDFPISVSLVDPVTTLVSILGLIGLVAAAFVTAKRKRLVSFAIVWFLGNLAIESSFLGLALVFEHRTYLPSVFVVAALAWAAVTYIRPRPLAIGFLCALTLLWGFWTYQRNAIWADEVALWQDVTEKSPNLARPWNNLGLALRTAGLSEEALTAFNTALTLDPHYTEARNNLGVLYQHTGKTQKAVQCFENVIKLNPGFAPGYLNMGKVLLDMDRPDQAEPFFQKALTLAPETEAVHYNLGLVRFRQTDLAAAWRHVNSALDLNPGYDLALNLAGSLHMACGNTGQAVALYRKALAITPLSAETFNNLGIALHRQGDSGQAMTFFRRALERNPGFADAASNLEKIEAALETYGLAIRALEQAVAASPGDPARLFQLGRLYAAVGMQDKALAAYEKTIVLKPDDAACLNALGTLYADICDIQKAITCFEKLARLAPDNAVVYYNLACLYARQHQVAPALTNLENALAAGYDDMDRIRTDKDLDNIRHTEAFDRLIQKSAD